MTDAVASLRQAANTLRERAGDATPGPWVAVAGAHGNPSDGPDHMRVAVAEYDTAYDAVARLEYDQQGGADAAWIALLGPDNGPDLAAILDWVADSLERKAIGQHSLVLRPALSFAERINGAAA